MTLAAGRVIEGRIQYTEASCVVFSPVDAIESRVTGRASADAG